MGKIDLGRKEIEKRKDLDQESIILSRRAQRWIQFDLN